MPNKLKEVSRLGPETREVVTVGSVSNVFRKWTEEPWANDPGIKAFSQAVINLLPENIDQLSVDDLEYIESMPDAGFISLYLETVDKYTSDSFGQDINVTSPYIAHMLFRSFMHTRIVMQDELVIDALYEEDAKPHTPPGRRKFPDDYIHSESWEELIRFNMDDPHFHMMVNWNLDQRRISTTHPNRYAGALIAIRQADLKLDHPYRIADLATGWGAGIRSVLKGDPPQHIKVMKALPAAEPNAFQAQLVYDEEATAELNAEMAKPLEIGESVGIDLMGARDKASELWGVASYILREQMDTDFMDRIYGLINYQDERLDFVTPLDLTDKTAFEEWIKKYQKENGKPPEFDTVLTFTMRHQLRTKRELEILRRNQNRITALGGIVVDQDFSHPSDWKPWGYKTTVRYPRRKSQPEVIAVWKDDRCTEVILGGDVTKIPDISE